MILLGSQNKNGYTRPTAILFRRLPCLPFGCRPTRI